MRIRRGPATVTGERPARMPLPRCGGKAEGSADPGARKLRPPILRPGAWLPRGRLRLMMPSAGIVLISASDTDLLAAQAPWPRPGPARARPHPLAPGQSGPHRAADVRPCWTARSAWCAPPRRPPQLARGPRRGAGQRPAHGRAQRRAVARRRADVAVHGARRGGRRGPRLPPGGRPGQPRPAGPLPVRHDPAHRGRVRTPRGAPRLRPAPARAASGPASPPAPPSASCSTARTRSPGTPRSWTRWPTPSRRPAATRCPVFCGSLRGRAAGVLRPAARRGRGHRHRARRGRDGGLRRGRGRRRRRLGRGRAGRAGRPGAAGAVPDHAPRAWAASSAALTPMDAAMQVACRSSTAG